MFRLKSYQFRLNQISTLINTLSDRLSKYQHFINTISTLINILSDRLNKYQHFINTLSTHYQHIINTISTPKGWGGRWPKSVEHTKCRPIVLYRCIITPSVRISGKACRVECMTYGWGMTANSNLAESGDLAVIWDSTQGWFKILSRPSQSMWNSKRSTSRIKYTHLGEWVSITEVVVRRKRP
jgi:hypothetical protein